MDYIITHRSVELTVPFSASELCFLSCWVCSERRFSRSVMNVRWSQMCVQRSPTQCQSRALAVSREAAGSKHRSPRSPTRD